MSTIDWFLLIIQLKQKKKKKKKKKKNEITSQRHSIKYQKDMF